MSLSRNEARRRPEPARSLGALGYHESLAADGQYDARTRLAVFHYQGWAGLQQDGQAWRETLTSLDRDANRPTPAGRPAELPAMPDTDAEFSADGSSLSLSGVGWSHLYFGRGATRSIDGVLNDPETGLTTDLATNAICEVADLGGPAGKACDALAAADKYNLARAVTEAVGTDACLEISLLGIHPTMAAHTYEVNDGRNCIP